MKQQKTILFLQSDSFCYDSAVSFQQNIAAEFIKSGWDVRQFSCPKDNACRLLKKLYGQHFDIIFDINSVLPAIREEQGDFCLNRIPGSVWHYILDHPLYHHEVLKCPLDDFGVICLDENHAAFIRQYYPHIKKVICLPLGAAQAQELIPYTKRTHDVIFTGTYTDSRLLLYRVTKLPAPAQKLFEQVVQFLFDHPALTQEKALSRFMDSNDLESLLQNMTLFTLADMFLRASTREEALFQLLKKEISITVYGHNWEQFRANFREKLPNIEQYLHIAGEVPYEKLPDIYADSKIAWNILPWFKAGIHDRIPMALMNGCVCVTDESSYLDTHFIDGEHLYLYSLEEMDDMAELVRNILQNPSSAAATAAKGYAHAVRHLSWKHWVASFLHQSSFS